MVRSTLTFGFLLTFLCASHPGLCQSLPFPNSSYQSRSRQCMPKLSAQPAPPVARSVNIAVPVPQAPHPCVPRTYGPGARYGCPPVATAPPPRPMPVRVGITVHPETRGQRRPVSVVYRDPGFLGPIICHSVGLVGAAISAPFRIAEMLCPLPTQPCRPRCSPAPQPPRCGSQRQPVPCFVPKCPVPCTAPAPPCGLRLACAPPGPSVAPLPPCATPQPCRPFMPPALVARGEEPPCAPQSLIGGLVNLPSRLLKRGRFVADMGGTSSSLNRCGR